MAYDRHFYRDRGVARSYESERFGSASGRRKHRHHVRVLLRALASLRGVRRVLDVPCGTGRFHPALRAAGYEVVGVDLSEAMLAEAPRPGRLVCTDVERAGVRTGAADLVMNLRHLSYVDDPPERSRMLAELARMAGRWVLVEYSPCAWTLRARLRRRARAFTREDVDRELGAAGLRLLALHPLSRLFSEKCFVVGEKWCHSSFPQRK